MEVRSPSPLTAAQPRRTLAAKEGRRDIHAPGRPRGFGWAMTESGVSVGHATFWRRLGALTLDGMILALVVTIPGAYLAWIVAGEFYYIVFPYIAFVPCSAYFIVGNGKGGTFGKRALGLRVRDANRDEQIGVGRGLVRYVVWLVGLYSFWLGWLSMIWDAQKQTWHDKGTNSIVVRQGRRPR